jgi:membrane-bound ClpP family serine protease
MLNILLDPNVGYLLLVGGFVLAVLALFAPGTGLLEAGALFVLLLAGYSLTNMPVNGWAVAVLILGVIPFVLALRRSNGRMRLILLLASIAAFILGSIFAFRSPTGGPAVNPLLAIIVSGGTGLLMWFMARKSLEAASYIPRHNLDHLTGMTGTARTDIRPEGTPHPRGAVYVDGEQWSAVSHTFIPTGANVRVIARRGLILEVEQSKEEDK